MTETWSPAEAERHWAREEVAPRVIVAVWTGWTDPEADFSFSMTDILLTNDGEYHFATTAGCSCPTYEESAQIEFSGTLESIIEKFEAEYANEYTKGRYETYAADVRAALTEALVARD